MRHASLATPTMSAAPELERGGIRAAREARRELARVIDEIHDEHAPLSARLAAVVGVLFGAEVGGMERVHAALRTARDQLRALVEDDAVVAQVSASRAASRALALIHPAIGELGRAIGEEDEAAEDDTQPFELSGKRPAAPLPDGEAERRGADRSTLEVAIGLEGDNRFYTGKTGDLSAGGLFVATQTPLAVGTELVLSFVLPDGYRVSAHAVVAWVRAPRYRPDELPVGMGIRFEALDERDRRAIEHFLEQRPAFRYGD
ncbi:MAG: TIGR02266 family protein [Sandaracinaceae bacterium]